jgi:hypothetical protein
MGSSALLFCQGAGAERHSKNMGSLNTLYPSQLISLGFYVKGQRHTHMIHMLSPTTAQSVVKTISKKAVCFLLGLFSSSPPT